MRRSAQLEGTQEAYDAYLEAYPEGPFATVFTQTLEQLRYTNADRMDNAEVWRAYLDQHPDGAHATEGRSRYERNRWADVLHENTPEAYDGFLAEFSGTSRESVLQRMRTSAAYIPNLRFENIETRQVNMGRNSYGDIETLQEEPLSGWGVFADVTNDGDQVLPVVKVRIDWLHPQDGTTAMASDIWYAAIPGFNNGRPSPPTIRPALAPGETRIFRYTRAEPPEGWEGQVALHVAKVTFERDEEEGEGE